MIVRELVTKLGFKTDTSSINKFEANVKNAKSAVLALTAAITASATAVFLFVESAAKAGDRLDKLRDTIGLTTKDYQMLEGAANLAGIENDEFSKSLQLFSRSIGMARQGMSQYIKEFAILGINMRGSNGQIKSNKELLLEVADAFQNKVTKNVDRAAIAQLLFGRSGLKMINFLEKGRAGVEEATKEFGKYAFILDKKAIKQSQVFRDSQFLLSAAFKGLKNEIGIGLMPVVQKAMNQTLKWAAANRKLIVHSLTKFFKVMIYLAKALGKIMSILVTVVSSAVGVWKHLNAAFGMTVKLLTGLIALKLLSKLKMFKSLMSGGLGLLKFIFSPIGLITAAIVALLLVLDDLAVYLTGGKSIIGLVIKRFPIIGKIFTKGLKAFKFIFDLYVVMPLKFVISLVKSIIKLMNNISARASSLATRMRKHFQALQILPDVGGAYSLKKLFDLNAAPSLTTNNASSRHINVNTSVSLAVPPGTSEMQHGFLKEAAKKSFEPVFNNVLINAFSAFPVVEQ